MTDRTVFQGDKTKLEDKTVLRKFEEFGNEINLDSDHSVSAFLSFF
jgi:hypothetical protein